MASPSTTLPPSGPMKRTAHPRLWRTLIVIGVLSVLPAIFFVTLTAQPSPSAPTGAAVAASYAVGSPGPGEKAPPFSLPSTAGGIVNLNDYRGKSVLLFFHEGIGCQPCWDQIRDLTAADAQLTSAGIDELVTITSGPVDLIAQKMSDDKLTALALADTRLDVSIEYDANKYGMMGDSRNGHSFVLVGPTGDIEWRADYGGAPDYTMYVPLEQILSDMQDGQVAS